MVFDLMLPIRCIWRATGASLSGGYSILQNNLKKMAQALLIGPTLQVWTSIVVRGRLAHGRTLASRVALS